MPDAPASFLDIAGLPIAYRHQASGVPGVVWLGGYKSDMLGTKAEWLAEFCATRGRSYLRHDYSGHGESGGAFADGTISLWVAQSLAVFREFARGPQIVVGSSMGAWVALRLIEEFQKSGEGHHVAGLVLIAPAPDFTVELIEPSLTRKEKASLAEKGYFEEPSDYSAEPYIYTRALIEDGRENRVMTAPIDTHCPVHILQGLKDDSVPSSHALKLASMLPADDVTVSLIPDGDHRLSRPQDLALLGRAIDGMLERLA